VLGLAREVATAYGLPLREPAEDSALATLIPATRTEVSVHLDDPDLGPRYAGAVADVTVGASPDWLQARLKSAGVRPISNVVDITNYVLLELGQPMHAFDLAKIGGAEIRVRRARAGETITTLDGQKRTLAPEMLVIADAAAPIAIAGVMGGADSEVGGATKTIVFESASFNANSVRRTSKALGLKTEASTRFERGVDPNLPLLAMRRACALLVATKGRQATRPGGGRLPQLRFAPRQLALRRPGCRAARSRRAGCRRHRHPLGARILARPAADGWTVTGADAPCRHPARGRPHRRGGSDTTASTASATFPALRARRRRWIPASRARATCGGCSPGPASSRRSRSASSGEGAPRRSRAWRPGADCQPAVRELRGAAAVGAAWTAGCRGPQPPARAA
jgi:hypothetical protein